jgi:hypothetical protein
MALGRGIAARQRDPDPAQHRRHDHEGPADLGKGEGERTGHAGKIVDVSKAEDEHPDKQRAPHLMPGAPEDLAELRRGETEQQRDDDPGGEDRSAADERREIDRVGTVGLAAAMERRSWKKRYERLSVPRWIAECWNFDALGMAVSVGL